MRRLRLARGGGAIMRLRTITPVERIGLLVRHPHGLTLKAKIEEDAARREGGQRKAAFYPGAPRPGHVGDTSSWTRSLALACHSVALAGERHFHPLAKPMRQLSVVAV